MAAGNSAERKGFLAGLLVLIAGVTWLVNAPSMFFEPVTLFPRIAIPVLLTVGFAGCLARVKALAFLGWIGLGCFILLALATAIPGEDYTLGGPNPPNMVSGLYVLLRLLLFLAIAVAIVISFRRLRVPRKNADVSR